MILATCTRFVYAQYMFITTRRWYSNTETRRPIKNILRLPTIIFHLLEPFATMEEKIRNIREASEAKLKFLYQKYRVHVLRYSLHIWFVRECLRRDLRPRFVLFSLQLDDKLTSEKISKWLIKKWLNSELQKWYGRKNVATRLLMMTHLRLAGLVDTPELLSHINAVDERCRQERDVIRNKKNRKLEALMKEKEKVTKKRSLPAPSFPPRVTYLTNTTFTKSEKELLGKGLQFAVPPLNRKKTTDNLLADLTVGLSRKNESATIQCAEILTKFPVDSVPRDTRDTIKSLRQKVRDCDLIVTKADKGNCTVVMERADYDQKIMTFINDNDGKLIDFDFCKYSVDVRRCIKDSEVIIPSEEKQRLISINPLPPRLYGLPKIHKEGSPIRPIVSFISSPTYHLCRYLDRWFKAATQFHSPHSVHNTFELVNCIKDVNPPPHSTLVSFDVTSLFTKVPLSPTVRHVESILQGSDIPHQASKEFLSLLGTCLARNVCKFKDEFYEFSDGLPMGSPLAPLMAEVFMSKLEDEIFSSEHPLTQHVAYWHRYVDDVLCLWTGPTTQLQDFLAFINGFYPPPHTVYYRNRRPDYQFSGSHNIHRKPKTYV